MKIDNVEVNESEQTLIIRFTQMDKEARIRESRTEQLPIKTTGTRKGVLHEIGKLSGKGASTIANEYLDFAFEWLPYKEKLDRYGDEVRSILAKFP